VSTAVESLLLAVWLQATNETDAVRAIAATAAKTNFFIIFFAFNLLNNQFAFKTGAKLRTFNVQYSLNHPFFLFFTKKHNHVGIIVQL
jgi:hypothetical protein